MSFTCQDEQFVDGSLVASCIGLTELSAEDETKVLLSPASVFDTLTESILLGESDSSLLQQDTVKTRVARGEIAKKDSFTECFT